MSVDATSSSAAASAASSATGGSSALDNLTSNFQDFLTLLMTQLQNQDPTSPMSSDTFTQELVGFAGVEQQIDTNTNLTSLIQLTQSGDLMDASSIVGHTVEATSSDIVLQDGRGTIGFTAPADGSVTVTVYDSRGAKIADSTVAASKGDNTWTWDGTETSGATAPDGVYKISVSTADSSGSATALDTTVMGKATGVVMQNGTLDLELGDLTVGFDAIKSVAD